MKRNAVRAHEKLAGRLAGLCEPLAALRGRVPLRRVAELEEGVWAVEAGVPYTALARALSAVEGGQWCASATGLTWLNGREACWLVEWGQVEAVTAARQRAGALGVSVRSWTLGGVARGLLKWTGLQQRGLRGSEAHLLGVRWAYNHCQPGVYQNVGLWDMEAAYHQVVQRLPSPLVDWTRGGPVWLAVPGPGKERWEQVIAAAAADKGLRTRLLGCMIGGGAGVQRWCRGQRLPGRCPRGPLPTAGLVVARTVYELCGLEVQASGAIYANTDCVIAPLGTRRTVWDSYGYRYRQQAAGAADVVATGCYQVGTRRTRPYGAGGRYQLPYPADPLPEPLTLSFWH